MNRRVKRFLSRGIGRKRARSRSGDRQGERSRGLHLESLESRVLLSAGDLGGTFITAGGEDVEFGSLTASGCIVSTGDLPSLTIHGDIAEGACVVIQGNLGELVVEGSIEGYVHVTGNVGSIEAGSMGLADAAGIRATVTAGGDIDRIQIEGQMKDSYILAGFDPGFGGEVIIAEFDKDDVSGDFDVSRFTVDGTAVDGREWASVGSIEQADIGVLNHSVIAAGVSPGENDVFGDLDGSDGPGTGLSRIEKANLGAITGNVNRDPFGVFADTSIGTVRLAGGRLPTPILQANGFRAWTLAETGGPGVEGFAVLAGQPFKLTLINGQGESFQLVVSMSGSGLGQVVLNEDGEGNFTGIDTIGLSGTDDGTTLRVQARGKATVDVGKVISGDDEGLRGLMIDGVLGNAAGDGMLDLGGGLGRMQVLGVAAGTEMVISGDLGSANLGTVQGSTSRLTTIEIIGQAGNLQAEEIESSVYMTVGGDLKRLTVKGDLAGDVVVGGVKVGSVMVGADLTGVVSGEGDISSVMVKGKMGGSVRAGWNLGRFSAGWMYGGVAAAGADFSQAQIRGDMSYSTLAAGLDIGAGVDLFDAAAVVAGKGDLVQVRVGGEFLESNLSAGVGPGVDGYFGTEDDVLQSRAVESVAAPRVKGVQFGLNGSGTDYDTIEIEFESPSQGRSSNIGKVVIGGEIDGSTLPTDRYAIIAAGQIGRVWDNGQPFNGDGNVVREMVSVKDLVSSSIEESRMETLAAALAASFIVQTDGLDHRFASLSEIEAGSADDDVVYGSDVRIEFDSVRNVAIFYKDSGFTINAEGTNYYKITLDSSQIVNRQGVHLDGDFSSGQWPTGNGDPGGSDFEYFFAVGDIGDTNGTAYSPFVGSLPENITWTYSSFVGDSLKDVGTSSQDDVDFYRFNGLEAGQVLDFRIENPHANWMFTGGASSYLNVQLLRIEPSGSVETTSVWLDEFDRRDDLDPVRDLVIPDLEMLAYSSGVFYGYEDVGGQFYQIDRMDWSVELPANDLDEINSLPEVVATGGTITGLKGLAGHSGDSLWTVGQLSVAGQGIRDSLILIENITATTGDTAELGVVISDFDLSECCGEIVGLAELDGVLYAVGEKDGQNTLVTIGSDPDDMNHFGGGLQEIGPLNVAGLRVRGLSVNLEGTGLLALHDCEVDNYVDPFDGLYSVDPLTGQAALWQEFYGDDYEWSGLAVSPGDQVLVGMPLSGSPVGDTIEITYDGQTQEHVFGGTASTDFGSVLTIRSDETDSDLLANGGQQEFVDEGYYYVFEVSYDTSLPVITIFFDDINWVNDTEFGQVLTVVTDDPVATGWWLYTDGSFELQIVPEDGDGDVMVYFAGSSGLDILAGADIDLAGKAIGTEGRDDLNPVRDMIVPGLDELTIAGNSDFSQNGIYNAVGYDSSQEIFCFVNTYTFDTVPILVADPEGSSGQVPLSLDVLTAIYQTIDSRITFNEIRGLDFGFFDETSGVNELWAVVEVTQTDPVTQLGTQRSSLLRIADIQEPALEMNLSVNDLAASGFTDVTELAFGNMLIEDADNGKLFGLDQATGTLIEFDASGKAVAYGGQVGNLGNPGGGGEYEIAAMDFDRYGRLIAVEDRLGSLVEIHTRGILDGQASERLELLQHLPQESVYRALTFDSVDFSGQSDGLLVRLVDGSPLGDVFDVKVERGGEQYVGEHTFGSETDTTVDIVTVSSVIDNDEEAVAENGGFYQFTVTYTKGQGEIELFVEDMNWLGGEGDLDSVAVDDEDYVSIVNVDESSVVLLIDTDNNVGEVTVYFGATADVQIPGVSEHVTSLVFSDMSAVGEVGSVVELPVDGDYLLVVGSQGGFAQSVIPYNMRVELFDDGNSDFGITETASGLYYDPILEGNEPVALTATSENDLDEDGIPDHLLQDIHDKDLYLTDHPSWPVQLYGDILVPGQAGDVQIDSELGNIADADVYMVQLLEGQRLSVDLDAEVLFGRDDVQIQVGVYNGDLEVVATIMKEVVDVAAPSDPGDSSYTVQAIFSLDKSSGTVELDPSEDGIGTYYIVVSGYSDSDVSDDIGYSLTVTTTVVEDIETPESQLVWLAFGNPLTDTNARADYLYLIKNDLGSKDVAQRPAFMAAEFGLNESLRDELIEAIAAQIEQIYRDAGLSEDEIAFTTVKPGSPGSEYAAGSVYTTVVFGGRTMSLGLGGIAETLDRGNSRHDDMAAVFTEEIGLLYDWQLDEDVDERFDQAVTLMANVGAHELGHILGLEHGTEVNTSSPNNLMGYNDNLVLQELEERTSSQIGFGMGGSPYQIGYQNEIDLLLRYIGAGTAMGEA